MRSFGVAVAVVNMSLECKFKEHSVVPDVIDVAPTTQADVSAYHSVHVMAKN